MASKSSIQFTQEGYDKLHEDKERLSKERAAVLIRLQTAREMGDLSENGAYKAARFELGSIDRQLRRLAYLLFCATTIKKQNNGTVGFGSTVTIQSPTTTMTFLLVDTFESDPKKKMLSASSPIGKAILGKRVGDTVEVKTPSGNTPYTILKLE